jgi:anaerobic selenocysteine-containing dehydrogenase
VASQPVNWEPVEAQPQAVEAAEGETVELKRTYCKVCMTMCGLVAEVAGDSKILKVKADRDHPLTRGYSCPKGRATGQIYHLDQPISRPMMRKNGELVEVSWDEALDDIAARLRPIIDEHGPNAVGMYFGSGLGLDSAGYSLEEAFYNALGTPPKFTPLTNDGTAKVMMSGAMARFYGINPKTDYDNCELVIYVGTNPMVSHAHNTGMFNPGNWLKAINKRGGEIWVIDPVRTETANYAAGHIAAYPGRDYAVLAWITREIIEGGPLNPRQPIKNLDALRALLKDYDRAKAAAIAGVPEQQLEDLLAAIRRKKIVAFETGTGVGMSPGCNLTVWFAWLIMILTGSMNTKGGLWMHPGFLFPFDQFVDHLPLLDSAFTPGSNVRPDVKGIMGDWPCAVLPLEIEAGNIRAFFNFGGHILRSFPDLNALTTALPKLDLHVSLEITHNELSPYCTHILPTKATVERTEFTRWDTLAWNVSLQYSPPLVKPMGERRSAWWVIAEFMKRAGLPVPGYVPDEPSDENDEFMLKQLMGMARCSWEELKDKRYVEFPLEYPSPWVDRHFERIGGWELMPDEIVAQWNAFRAEDEANLGKPRPLVYSSRRQRRKFNGQISFLGEPADILLHPETAAEHGITDGQDVRVFNKSGEIVVTAKIDDTVMRGVASIPHGHFHANVNNLTSVEDMDPLGGMALYSGVPVEIAPA